MGLTVNLQHTGSMNRGTGPGLKVVQGIATITPATRALRAADVGLMIIHDITVHNSTLATVWFPFIITPGSYRNSASFDGFRRRVASGTLTLANTGLAAGTHAIPFTIIGE